MVYEEHDDSFYMGISRTRYDRFICISVSSRISDELRFAPAANPAQFTVLAPRERDVEYDADHHDDRLLRVYAPWKDGRVNANRATLSFRAFGQSGVTATFTFCDDRGAAAARAVVISQTGRPRVSNRSASNGPLTCI